jgi:hypothetical protein
MPRSLKKAFLEPLIQDPEIGTAGVVTDEIVVVRELAEKERT